MGFIYCDVHETMGFFIGFKQTQPAILMDPKGFVCIQWLGGSVSELGLLIFPKKWGGSWTGSWTGSRLLPFAAATWCGVDHFARERRGLSGMIGQGKDPNILIWLVVNGCHEFGIFPEILGFDYHPNGRTHIFSEGWPNHQPDSYFNLSETTSDLPRFFSDHPGLVVLDLNNG